MKVYCCDIYCLTVIIKRTTISSTSLYRARRPRSTQTLTEVGVVALCRSNLVRPSGIGGGQGGSNRNVGEVWQRQGVSARTFHDVSVQQVRQY
jgi:hypothetical protein